jgi:dienelactone hydrolase
MIYKWEEIKMRMQKLVLVLVLSVLFSVVLTPAPATGETVPGPFAVGELELGEGGIPGIPMSAILCDESNTPTEYPCMDAENKAVIYYPKTGGDMADAIFPLIIYGHAHRPEPGDITEDYKRVSNLLGHLASWGFVIIAPDQSWLWDIENMGENIANREIVLRDAVNYMLEENFRAGSRFENKIRTTSIGAMGHSMGTDAAVLLGTSEDLQNRIGAIALIAPPNHVSDDHIANFTPKPLIILQGTADLPWYTWGRAEEIYEAAEATKHLVTITDANHFGYTDDISEKLDPEVLPRADQQKIAKAYLTAFFQRYLKLGCVEQLDDHLDDTVRFEGLEGFTIEAPAQIGDEVGGGLNWVFAKIADTNTYIPGGTGNFTDVGSPSINDNGNVVFWGVGDDHKGIYTYLGSTLGVVADTNTFIPQGGTERFTRFGSPVIDDVGNVAFWTAGDDREGIYTYIGGTLGVSVDTSTPIPGGTGNFTDLSLPSLDYGNVAFWAAGDDQEGIYTDVGGVLHAVADTNGCCGRWDFTDLLHYPSLDDGHVAFGARISTGLEIILTDHPNPLGAYIPHVTTDTPIPCGTGNFNYLSAPDLSDGKVMFWGAGDGQAGIYTGFHFNLNVLADTDTPAPGDTKDFDLFFYPRHSTDNGNVAFNGVVAGDGAGSNQWGIYTTIGKIVSKVIDLDTSLDGKDIKLAGLPATETPMLLSHEGLSESSVAFMVNLTDSSKAVYRASLDSDWDWLPDYMEIALGTNLLDPDSDDDGLLDNIEVTELGTDPLNADSDGDGIPDGEDVEWLQNAINALPSDPLSTGHRTSASAILDAVEGRVARGQISGAVRMLENLKMRVDGCGVSPDRNDWIIVCYTQVKFRELLDLYILNLHS